MKVIIESSKGKIKCDKLASFYFRQLIESLPTHRILKIFGVIKSLEGEPIDLLLMKSSHSSNKWYYKKDWEFDYLRVEVAKKKYKKPKLETIQEE
jgi:hypothetical protein